MAAWPRRDSDLHHLGLRLVAGRPVHPAGRVDGGLQVHTEVEQVAEKLVCVCG